MFLSLSDNQIQGLSNKQLETYIKIHLLSVQDKKRNDVAKWLTAKSALHSAIALGMEFRGKEEPLQGLEDSGETSQRDSALQQFGRSRAF